MFNTTNITNKPNTTLTVAQSCYITFSTVNTYNWVIFIIGSLGNILSIIIMNRARMRSNTTSITITTLAIADTLTLLLKCLQSHLKLVQAVHYSCFLIEYFLHVCVLTSIWIIVWMTIERALAVWCPLQINNWLTKLILICIFACTAIIFGIFNLHFLIAYEAKPLQPWSCQLINKYQGSFYITTIYYWLKAVFYSWLPIFIIITTNLMILYAIYQASKSRVLLMSNSRVEQPNESKVSYFRATERQLTIMLLCVSITFVMLTLPFSVYQLYFRFKSKKLTCFERDLNRFVISLADLNHAINFVLYCISGRKFRSEVKRLANKMLLFSRNSMNTSSNKLNHQCKRDDSSKVSGNLNTMKTHQQNFCLVSVQNVKQHPNQLEYIGSPDSNSSETTEKLKTNSTPSCPLIHNSDETKGDCCNVTMSTIY